MTSNASRLSSLLNNERKTKLLTIQRWIDETYDAQSAPTTRTVRNWIYNGLLAAEKHGKTYYIHPNARPNQLF